MAESQTERTITLGLLGGILNDNDDKKSHPGYMQAIARNDRGQ